MSVFNVHCTIPSEVVRYVSSPNARGTLNILWSCVPIVFLCTWTVLKLPVRPRRPEEKEWKWRMCLFLRKLALQVPTLLAPELLVGIALEEYRSIRSSYQEMKKWAIKDGVDWSYTHSYFTNMGGFVVDFGTQKAPDSQNIDGENQSRNEKLGEEAIQMLNKRGNLSETGSVGRHQLVIRNVLQANKWRLNTDQLFAAREQSIIASLPELSTDMLDGLSSSDSLAQLLIVVQITWLVINFFFRRFENLTSSQLEISVFGFSLCAIIAYGLQWQKPKDVHIEYHVKADRDPKDAVELIYLGSLGPVPRSFHHFVSPINDEFYSTYLFGSAASGAVFGLIHCAAWNSAFPTDIERRLWRTASLTTVLLPIVLTSYPFFILMIRTKCSVPKPLRKTTKITFDARNRRPQIDLILFYFYFLARLCILVEDFRTLFFLPPKAFRAGSTFSLPNIG